MKTAKEKQRRLSEIIKSCTYGKLSNYMIKQIVKSIEINNQYLVTVFSDSLQFWKAVRNAEAGNRLRNLVHPQYKMGPVAAVILTRKQHDNTRAICIYCPCESETGRICDE
jgi:hypothetical protein